MKDVLGGVALAVVFLTLVVVLAGVDSVLVRVLAGAGIVGVAWVLLRPFIVGWLRGVVEDVKEQPERRRRRR